MKAEYVELLPAPLKDLVRDTEEYIGFPIDVVVAPERARGMPDGASPLACEVEKDAARLLIPSVDQFPPGAVFHELQHIRRFLVEGVPQLVDCEDYEPWTPEMGTALTRQDNALEHLVIVPRELNVFPERRTHWENVMQQVWAEIEAGEGSDVDRKHAGWACWAFLLQVTPDSSTVDVARRVLAGMGAIERGDQFYEALLPALGDKVAAVRVWFEHLGIPLEMASLKYYAPRELRSWEVPLVERA
ncbi:hypothetical protein J9978_07610 [Chromobacterium violaceum]|uniref:hypothetical protein n=1 Tax=Chromobacterium violaceum TaxID=536 RepID=UPI001B33922C|nr:hypothetical protein [Chromobacterium violaceum]MBP4049364.1 hypothetical protein [Chromobacterium violaceum]